MGAVGPGIVTRHPNHSQKPRRIAGFSLIIALLKPIPIKELG